LNKGRRSSAEDVEVLLLDATSNYSQPQDDKLSDGATDPIIKNYALKWSMIPTRRLRLGAGVQRWVDLAFAVEVSRGKIKPPIRRLFLPVKDLPWTSDDDPLAPETWNTEGHILNTGIHRLHIALSAQGATSRHYDVDITLKSFDQEPILRNAIQVISVAPHRNPR
jgi:hypothetical protein